MKNIVIEMVIVFILASVFIFVIEGFVAVVVAVVDVVVFVLRALEVMQ